MLRLRRLVRITSNSVIVAGVEVVDLVVIGQRVVGKQDRDPIDDRVRPAARRAGVRVGLGA